MPTTLSGTTYLTTPGTTVLDNGSSATGTVYLDAGHVLEVSGNVTSSGATIALGDSGAATSAGDGRVVIDDKGQLRVSGNTLFENGVGSTILQNNGVLNAGGASNYTTIDVPFVNTGTLNVDAGHVTLSTSGRLDSSNRGVINIDVDSDMNYGVLTFAGTFYNAGVV